MKLKFENFIENKEFNDMTKEIFKEAIICYKNSAYRASLLLSYLGFIEIIRHKINISEPAQNYDQTRWKKEIIFKINNDEIWDKHIYDILMREKTPIFALNPNLKTQITYWKDRRNDCAHLKKNNITNSHIEAFWEFLESNIDKFIINDSIDFVVNLFLEYFNSDYKKYTIDTLISKVCIILNKEMFEIFLDSITEQILKSNTNNIFNFFSINSKQYPNNLLLLYSTLMLKDISEFKDILSKKVLTDNILYYELCEYEPRTPNFIPPNDELIKIFYENNCDSSSYRGNLFKSFISLIPLEKKEDAYKKFLRFTTESTLLSNIKEDYFFFRDFLEFCKNYLFTDGNLIENFNWANTHKNFIIFLIEIFNFDKSLTGYIKKLFSKQNYPYDLKEAINNSNDNFKNKFYEE